MAYGLRIKNAAGAVIFDSSVDTIMNTFASRTITKANWVKRGDFLIWEGNKYPIYYVSWPGLDPLKHFTSHADMRVDTNMIVAGKMYVDKAITEEVHIFRW